MPPSSCATSSNNNDGMEDGWEVAYFGDLSRNGSSDYDHDGKTDLQEYQAGTDPTNQGSVLRVLTLTSINNTNVSLLWSAVLGRSYRVQYKTDLADPWTDLPGDVVPSGTTGVKIDTSAPPNQRFYRVCLLPLP